MKKSPILLSLCALSLLSACAKDNNTNPNVGVAPITNPDEDIDLRDDRGSDHGTNVRMIRAGLRQSDEIRRQGGLAPLQFDYELTIIAQRRARELKFGNSPYQDPRQMPAGPDGRPGSGYGVNPGSREWHDEKEGRDRGGRDPRGEDRNQPGRASYAAENILFGIRSPEQAFRSFSSYQSQNTRINLLSPMYRRHGLGYFDGTWVELFAY